MRPARVEVHDRCRDTSVLEDELAAEVDDLLEPGVLRQPAAQRPSLVGLEERPGHDEAQPCLSELDPTVQEEVVDVGLVGPHLGHRPAQVPRHGVIGAVGRIDVEVRRVADDGAEATFGEDLTEAVLARTPVERTQPVLLLGVELELLLGVEVGAHEAVATADVGFEGGQERGAEAHLRAQELGRVGLQRPEIQAELCYLDGRRIDVHTEDTPAQEPCLALRGQALRPRAVAQVQRAVDGRVLGVVALEPADEVVEGTDQEGSRAARRVDHPRSEDVARWAVVDQGADGAAHDLLDDPSGRVVDATGLAHLRFELDRHTPILVEG